MASISKRGRYWRAQIVRRGYPPQYRTFDTRAEAEAWTRGIETEMDRGVFLSRVESEQTTLAEALDRYQREISSGKAHPEQDYQRVGGWLRQGLPPRQNSCRCAGRPARSRWCKSTAMKE